jgi:holliday junction DNA helicase RuvA
MIGLLRGRVVVKDIQSVILDVQGVGYKVLLSNKTLSQLTTGDETVVFIHTHVREDLLELYGFPDQQDLKLFELLIGVSGVGCKSALGIFSIGNRGEVVNAIINNNVAFFMAVPRLGKKNAQKIIIELKSKLGDKSDIDLGSETSDESIEVIEALKAFGFTNKEAATALQSLNGEGDTTEDKIRKALKYLGK